MCDSIDGLAVNQSEEQVQGHTVFVSEAATCAEVPGSLSYYTLEETQDNQDLKAFFERPRAISAGSITAGVGLLDTEVFPHSSAFLSSRFGTVALTRLSGVAGFRATIRFTLTTTCTPFHQGLLGMSWQYATATTGVDARGEQHQVLAANLPHVKLDLAEETLVTLDVPYVSSYEYIPIDSFPDIICDYGRVHINRLSDIRVVAGQAAPTYNLYVSLHDMELIGVAPLEVVTAVLQAGATKEKGLVKNPIKTVSKKISQMSAEAKRTGVISKTLGTMSKVAGIASYVPGFSMLGGTTSWLMDKAAKTAASFGYSKPVDENIPTRVTRYGYAGEAHADMPNNGWVVSAFQTNKLAVDGRVGCMDEDQMAFDYVLTKPSIICRKSISTTVARGDLVYGCIVSPSCLWYRDNATQTGNISLPTNATLTTNCILPSTLMYVASNFRLWRGNLKYIFKFCKSKMHGGRVVITYTPRTLHATGNSPLSNTVPVPDNPGFGQNPQGLSTIVDLKDGSEFEFVVPFVYSSPFCRYYDAIGALTVHMISPLNTPNTAASTIDMLVSVAAEPGFELSSVAPSNLDGGGAGTYAVYQSGVGGVEVIDTASEQAIGESFSSLKQLLLIPDYAQADLTGNFITELFALPWFAYSHGDIANPIGGSYSTRNFGAKGSRISRMFSFANGSTVLSVMRGLGDSTNVSMTGYNENNDGGETLAGISIYNRSANRAGTISIPETMGAGRFIFPTHSRFARIPTCTVPTNYWGSQQINPVDSVVCDAVVCTNKNMLRVRNNNTGAVRFLFGTAAGDDAILSQFIGPPRCLFFQSTAANQPNFTGNFPLW